MTQSLSTVYWESVTSPSFWISCGSSLVMFVSAEKWAMNTKTYVGTTKQRQYFAEQVVSFLHVLIAANSACLQLWFDTELTRRIWCFVSGVSCTYLLYSAVMHEILSTTRPLRDKIVLVLHHLLTCFPGIPITNPNVWYLNDEKCSDAIYFITPAFVLIEVSTVWLNLRILTKLFQKETCFFFSSICVMLTYFPLRCIWLPYLMYVAYQSKSELTMAFGDYAIHIVEFVFGFVYLMSLGYSVVMMKSGKKFFFLKGKKKCAD